MPTENSFVPLFDEEMARNGFSTVSKRKRYNTGQGDSCDSRDIFMHSSAENKLNIMFDEILCIRGNQEETNRGMSTFQNSFRLLTEKLGQVADVTNRNTNMLKTLAYKSIDLEARSRRNNLIFWGISENQNENCFYIIREFIKNHFDLDADKMYLARAHRLGPRKIGYQNPKRPIIVNFRDYCDTEMIMGRAYMLKNTPFSIDFDLPKEISEARKRLWSELKVLKSRNPRIKYQILYPAKLLVDGKIVRDEFPDWNGVIKSTRLVDFSHIDIICNEQVNSRGYYPMQTGQTRDNGEYTNLMNENPTGEASRDHMEINSDHISTTNTGESQQCENESVISVSPPVSAPDVTQMNNSINNISTNTSKHSNVPDGTISTSLFRPFSSGSSFNTSADVASVIMSEGTEQIVQSKGVPSENPGYGAHISRSKQRVVQTHRTQSLSIPRLTRGTTEIPGDKNRHNGSENKHSDKASTRAATSNKQSVSVSRESRDTINSHTGDDTGQNENRGTDSEHAT